MEQVVNFGHTTLAEDLDGSETTVTVTDGSVFSSIGVFRMVVDDEIMRVTSRSGNDLTVQRGAEGTSATTHSNGTAIHARLTAAALQAIIIGSVGSLNVDVTVSGAHTIDRDDGATHVLTLTDDATLTPDATTIVSGEAIDLRVIVRPEGNTVSWGGTIDWVGGSAPEIDDVTTVGLLSVDDAVSWLGYATSPSGSVTGAQLEALGAVGALLIADEHSTPIVFGDLLLTEEEDDFLYADLG